MSESLLKKGKRWSDQLRNSACGPLLIARSVVELADQWDAYKTEAGGLSCTAWLKEQLGDGKTLGYFRKRVAILDAIGDDMRTAISDEVAVWLFNSYSSDPLKLQRLKVALVRKKRENGGNPATIAMAYKIAEKLFGKTIKPVRPVICPHCGENIYAPTLMAVAAE